MSKKRMFDKSIVMHDVFLDLPLSAQALYFHLCMNADDWGFVSPKSIMRMINANEDDLKLLILKRYILIFDSGVVVIKHWFINNTIRQDRSHETTFKDEFKSLVRNSFGAYTEKQNITKIAEEIVIMDEKEKKHIRPTVVRKMQTEKDELTTLHRGQKSNFENGKPNGNQMATQNRIEQNRIYNTTSKLPDGNVDLQKQIQRVYECFVNSFNKNPNQLKLTETRKQKIKRRLREFTEEEIMLAIKNASEDDFFNGGGIRGWIGTIDYLFKSTENVEKYVNLSEAVSKISREDVKRYV